MVRGKGRDVEDEYLGLSGYLEYLVDVFLEAVDSARCLGVEPQVFGFQDGVDGSFKMVGIIVHPNNCILLDAEVDQFEIVLV